MTEARPTPWRAPSAVLAMLVAGTAAVLVGYGAAWLPGGAPPWASWAMVIGMALLLPGTLLLGALRRGRNSVRLVLIALALGLLLVVAFGAALLLPAAGAEEALFLGLPRRAAIIVYGVGLVPLLFLPWAFARDFRDFGLDEARLDALRRECARVGPPREPRP
ncbi:MAG: hypothetical protein IPP98_15335 [Gemmatimonadetes bacterium]|nr:hypothetical protein [Gemmatimonadota bacterium]